MPRTDAADPARRPQARRPRRVARRAVWVAVLVIALVLTSCSRRRDTSAPPSIPVSSTTSAAAPASVGPTTSESAPSARATSGTSSSGANPPANAAVIHPATAPKGGSTEVAIKTPDGRDRTYHVYVPSHVAAGAAVPLLVGLHGGLGRGTQFEEQSGFDGLAEANTFIVVYPDGIEIPILNKGRVFNGGGCCAPAEDDRQNVDDVTFISMVIDDVSRQHSIDPRRVFVTGHSNGAIMAYRYACAAADKVAAIGMQAGTLFVDPCHPAAAVSLIEIHGTADKNIPITGGVGDRSISQKDFPSPATSVQTWAGLDGCHTPPTETTDPGNAAVTTDAFAGCPPGLAVEMVTVTGANHAWMGHEATKASQLIVGTPYMGLDSSLTIWTFLAAHPRP